jgi:NAD(P) transhydrogenase subunit beta
MGRVAAMDDLALPATRPIACAKRWTGFAACSRKKTPVELNILRVELFLGVFIGAVTFTGSVVAYGKLAGKVTALAAASCPAGTHAERRRRLPSRCCA